MSCPWFRPCDSSHLSPFWRDRRQLCRPHSLLIRAHPFLAGSIQCSKSFSTGSVSADRNFGGEERAMRTVNLGEVFIMTQFERGATTALRTALSHLFDILYACNGLPPHRDHFSLLVLAPKFTKATKPVFDRVYTVTIQTQPGERIRVFFESMITTYVDPNSPGYSRNSSAAHSIAGPTILVSMMYGKWC